MISAMTEMMMTRAKMTARESKTILAFLEGLKGVEWYFMLLWSIINIIEKFLFVNIELEELGGNAGDAIAMVDAVSVGVATPAAGSPVVELFGIEVLDDGSGFGKGFSAVETIEVGGDDSAIIFFADNDAGMSGDGEEGEYFGFGLDDAATLGDGSGNGSATIETTLELLASEFIDKEGGESGTLVVAMVIINPPIRGKIGGVIVLVLGVPSEKFGGLFFSKAIFTDAAFATEDAERSRGVIEIHFGDFTNILAGGGRSKVAPFSAVFADINHTVSGVEKDVAGFEVAGVAFVFDFFPFVGLRE